ncbi:MAG TPA: N,N-dimethylformamidase beta subunit family domain-containing protein [Casimicrobiaceae bacterium]|nr:N,N-dimethylformamidase beta subunit family domain-containing protein [Casimicrobiaceae bacterium]
MPNLPSESVQPLEAYASATSVIPGGEISFHVSVKTPGAGQVAMDIYRSSQLSYGDSQFGLQADSIYLNNYRQQISVRPGSSPLFQTSFAPASYATPPDAATNGCGWPVAVSWQVPDVASSVYVARFTYQADTTYALFVVRPANPGTSKILCQVSVNTHQAYNPWGGFSFYGPPISSDFVSPLSFDRPCQLWDYILYDEPIITWLERNYAVEFCTNIDLHSDGELLNPYQLFISAGHDEYWSAIMRDRIDAFAAAGGNVMFLTGNTCYRPVDFDGRRMVRLADSWQALGRAEALTTGLNWCAGHWSSPLPAKGYTVQMPSHWVFDGTGLHQGDLLGEAEGIMGYETDAAVCNNAGNPIAPTPSDFMILANATLDDWRDVDGRQATMGMYLKNDRGVVFAAGTTGWSQGLRSNAGNVQRVSQNLVNCLRYRFGEGDLLRYIDHNRDGTADVGAGEIIWRGGWNQFAHVFSGGDDMIYAVTADGNLLWYGSQQFDVDKGKVIGHGGWNDFVYVFSGGGGILYAVTGDGNLLWYKDRNRDGSGDVANGQIIGDGGWSDFSNVFSGGDGVIYAITPDNELLWFKDQNCDGTGNVANGQTIGQGDWNNFVNVFGGDEGVIYAITQDGDLLWFLDANRDGTGNVGDGKTIGHGGWNAFASTFGGAGGMIYAITKTAT